MSEQQTLSGGTTEKERERPSTFMYDPDADEYILPTRVDRLEKDLYESKEAFHDEWDRNKSNTVTVEEEDEPMEIGGTFNVRISYSASFSANVDAFNEDQAEEKVKELVEFGNLTSADHVHTSTDKRSTIYEDDPEADELDY